MLCGENRTVCGKFIRCALVLSTVCLLQFFLEYYSEYLSILALQSLANFGKGIEGHTTCDGQIFTSKRYVHVVGYSVALVTEQPTYKSSFSSISKNRKIPASFHCQD